MSRLTVTICAVTTLVTTCSARGHRLAAALLTCWVATTAGCRSLRLEVNAALTSVICASELRGAAWGDLRRAFVSPIFHGYRIPSATNRCT
jgi:hypothetical protein